jgi:hypothetical protein
MTLSKQLEHRFMFVTTYGNGFGKNKRLSSSLKKYHPTSMITSQYMSPTI